MMIARHEGDAQRIKREPSTIRGEVGTGGTVAAWVVDTIPARCGDVIA
jgi:hypothetical protein